MDYNVDANKIIESCKRASKMLREYQLRMVNVVRPNFKKIWKTK